jgi:hypothetical protein
MISDNNSGDDVYSGNEQERLRLDGELSYLFGSETVAQAALIDAADLNLNEVMTACITDGLTRLKQLRNDPGAQLALVRGMQPGERLVLCMWIREMGLLDKIQARPYT